MKQTISTMYDSVIKVM